MTTTSTNEPVHADANCREHGVPAWRCCDDHPGRTIDATDPSESDDDHPDFAIVSVEPVCVWPGSDVPSYYRVTARLFGEIAHLVDLHPIDDSRKTWGGLLATWLGMYAPNGAGCALTSAGWDSADQWIDATVDRVLGTAAAVGLGERILAAAVVP